MAEQEGVEFIDPDFDCMFKILLTGNSGVGKTAFLIRYTDDSFFPTFVSTVGIDYRIKTMIRWVS
jgi:GTPase SAR1 family protein